MRKLLLLLATLSLVAAACSSDGSADVQALAADTGADSAATQPDSSDTGADSAATQPDSSDPEHADDVVPAEAATAGEGAAEDGAATASEGGVDTGATASTCGFGAELEPEHVEVVQIAGEGRGENPSAIDNPLPNAFPEPLVDLNRIISGGVPVDGIPPIDRPVFQRALSVDWLQCTEPVLSLSLDGEARAYPVQVMTWHEIVNDTFNDVPVTVSYCPLCNSSLAYRRDLGDRVVTFGTSGRLFNSSLVMYDRETQSLWTHFNGAAVAGTLTGTQLELLPMQTTSWQSFLEAHPNGLVLTRDTGHGRPYGQNPYSGYDNVETDPFLFDGEADPRLAAKERIVGLRAGDDSVAVVLSALAEAGVLVTDLDGTAVSVWHLPGTASALEAGTVAGGRDVGAVGVYVPEFEGQRLTFSRDADGNFIDAETGSTWNILGISVDGQLSGAHLSAVEHVDTFWFALAAFEPNTRVVES